MNEQLSEKKNEIERLRQQLNEAKVQTSELTVNEYYKKLLQILQRVRRLGAIDNADEYVENGRNIKLSEPQIVNGCQSAKTITNFFRSNQNKEIDGRLLVKIIRTKRSDTEEEKKKLRDDITRYTNSQNAVRGLDFYALEGFQRDLQDKLEKLGYYYEIQRGSFVALSNLNKQKYKGENEYSYLVNNKFKNVLPAKEIVQSFAAGIRQMPHTAYGRPSELTPNGDKWNELINEEATKLDIKYFLLPYLVLYYAKNNLGYNSSSESYYKKSSALLFTSTYFLFLTKLYQIETKTEINSPAKVDISYYVNIFSDINKNIQLLNHTDEIIHNYISNSLIEDEVGADLKNFLKNVSGGKRYKKAWDLLERKIDNTVNKYYKNNVICVIKVAR